MIDTSNENLNKQFEKLQKQIEDLEKRDEKLLEESENLKNRVLLTVLELAVANITKSGTSWADFIKKSAFFYKYKFSETLIILSTKPNATACGELKFWKNLNAKINTDAVEIPLVDLSTGNIRYVYDISDTNSNYKLWQADKSLINIDDLNKRIEDSIKKELNSIPSSSIKEKYISFLTDSLKLSVYSRCGYDTSEINNDFSFVKQLDKNQYYSFNSTQKIIHRNLKNILTYIEKNFPLSLFAYLTKTKGLDADIVQQLINDGSIKQNIEGNATFQIFAPLSEMLAGDIMTTGYSFKVNPTEENPKEAIFFENPIQLLSYYSLHKDTKSLLVSLSGIDNVAADNIILQTMEDYSLEPKSCYISPDNDEPGIRFAEHMKDKYGVSVHSITDDDLFKKYSNSKIKDWNNLLFAEKNSALVPNEQGIIGNITFKYIKNKIFRKLHTEIALKVAAEFMSNDIKFSGKINADKTTLTVSKADIKMVNSIIDRLSKNVVLDEKAAEIPKESKIATKDKVEVDEQSKYAFLDNLKVNDYITFDNHIWRITALNDAGIIINNINIDEYVLDLDFSSIDQDWKSLFKYEIDRGKGIKYLPIGEKMEHNIKLYKMGDFYEAFNEDAFLLARYFNLNTVKKTFDNKSIPMVGIPYHSLESYIYRLKDNNIGVSLDDYNNFLSEHKLNEESVINDPNNEFITTDEILNNVPDNSITIDKQKQKNEEKSEQKFIQSDNTQINLFDYSSNTDTDNKTVSDLIENTAFSTLKEKHNFSQETEKLIDRIERQMRINNIQIFSIDILQLPIFRDTYGALERIDKRYFNGHLEDISKELNQYLSNINNGELSQDSIDSIKFSVNFTENSILQKFINDNEISFALGNAILKYLDTKADVEYDGGYDKTDFVIDAVVNGKNFNYEGRFDIGSEYKNGYDGLIGHIEEYYKYQLEENPNNLTPEELNNCRDIINTLVPFLKKNEQMTLAEQKIFEDFCANNPIEDNTIIANENQEQVNNKNTYEFEYRLLQRLKQDCDYFLGAGNRYEGHLWAGNVQDQIKKMRELYDIVPEKPEWLLKQDIDHYAENMLTMAERNNFVITNNELGQGSAKEKFHNNIEAIKVLKNCEEENRIATPEEREILSRYVGWGGLADAFDERKWANEYKELKELLTPEDYAAARSSTLNAHYTSPAIIKAIYNGLDNMGFKHGKILEPAMGIGNFFGAIPENMKNSKLYGVELDTLSGRIAKQLYPDANIQIKGFEKTAFQSNFFDVAIGNVPFGNYKIYDNDFKKGDLIHDYFFKKSLDKVRPGGVVAFITSKGTLDKKDSSVRQYLAERAELLGAVRLPNNAFANANTEVTSDIIFLQKRDG